LKRNPARSKRTPAIRVGVDTGGTFTDFVFLANHRLEVFKLPSTPHDPSVAITDGLDRIAHELNTTVDNLEVIHGTTVGTNALLQRRGARVALVTTAGFEDVIEIGRQARPELYNLNATKPLPLVQADLRFGAKERVISSGEIIQQLSDETIRDLVERVSNSRAESVAISLLFSFVYSEHETRIAAALKELNLPISVSHQILPEYREYERTSTVVVNAYLQPLLGAYLERLQTKAANLSVMQSSGGIISASAAAEEPVRTILSGPSGGVVGALQLGKTARVQNLITFDMGGTSTDVALCDANGMRMTNEAIVAGVPVAVSMMDIHTVGAGGGSIARVDEGGSLRVGPESAGADPGPACYGRSTLPTVTDAHVVLGHFASGGLLGGDFQLDERRALNAMRELATRMSEAASRKFTAIQAASGVLSVVNTNMERALRRISVERGYDPREFVLIPFGGAGGLHAVDLARGLRIPRVLVPSSGGALSALGVVTADVVKDQSRTVMLEVNQKTNARLNTVFRELEKAAKQTLRAEGFPATKQRHERAVAMRYQGQSFELEIKIDGADLGQKFHKAHCARYGYSQDENAIEIVSVRLRSVGLVEQIRSQRLRPLKDSVRRTFMEMYLDGERVRAAVYARPSLARGTIIRGPAVITEYSATTLLPKRCVGVVDDYGNIVISINR
jgi:N-methylhydantoinase A